MASPEEAKCKPKAEHKADAVRRLDVEPQVEGTRKVAAERVATAEGLTKDAERKANAECGAEAERKVEAEHKVEANHTSKEKVETRHRLLKLLRMHGLKEKPVRGDGCCQFRALADQLYGTEAHHSFVRQQVVEQLKKHRNRYHGFVLGGFDRYLAGMSQAGTWGDNVTLQAFADALGLRIHVLSDTPTDGFIQALGRGGAPAAARPTPVLTWPAVLGLRTLGRTPPRPGQPGGPARQPRAQGGPGQGRRWGARPAPCPRCCPRRPRAPGS